MGRNDVAKDCDDGHADSFMFNESSGFMFTAFDDASLMLDACDGELLFGEMDQDDDSLASVSDVMRDATIGCDDATPVGCRLSEFVGASTWHAPCWREESGGVVAKDKELA